MSQTFVQQATLKFKKQFRVNFRFDGAMTTNQNQTPTEKRRAVGFDGDKDTFTWKRFITLEDSFNPYPGLLNPWSLRNWYEWGCRNFHLHNPFGKVAQGNSQELVYEVDQLLTAQNGLTINGTVQNTPMPWLVDDFVDVFKALTTGTQGNLDQLTWDSWTTGQDAWFDPTSPIDVIVYIGAMCTPGDDAYRVYLSRWNKLFLTNRTAAEERLKNSVRPLIDANCKIAFDACVVSPGPIAGRNVALSDQNAYLQKGWWKFFTWVVKTIGKSRVYVESHPFKKAGANNPYLGYNVIADDEWSYSKFTPAGPNGPHLTSEMGNCEFWRGIWQNESYSTPLISTGNVKERYWFLNDVSYTHTDPNTNEKRLDPAICCNPNHNYYHNDIYASIIAYHILEKQHIRWETNKDGNITMNGFLVPYGLLQVLPAAYPNDPAWNLQFGQLYPTSTDFILYLASLLESKKTIEKDIYAP